MQIDNSLSAGDLSTRLSQFFAVAGPKLIALDQSWDPAAGSPVFTEAGRYTSRGWTEWTQGFQYGCLVLQYDATNDSRYLDLAIQRIHDHMAPHVSHTGVHDHGFNNLSTYGNVLRLADEGRIPLDSDARAFYALAIKVSGGAGGALVAHADGTDISTASTARTPCSATRSVPAAFSCARFSSGTCSWARATRDFAVPARWNTSRHTPLQRLLRAGADHYDVAGVVHESIFNMSDGQYRCPSTQQGYSPFSVDAAWRGCCWARRRNWFSPP